MNLFSMRVVQVAVCGMVFNALLLLFTKGVTSMMNLPVEVSNLFIVPLMFGFMLSVIFTVVLLIGNMWESLVSKVESDI